MRSANTRTGTYGPFGTEKPSASNGSTIRPRPSKPWGCGSSRAAGYWAAMFAYRGLDVLPGRQAPQTLGL